MRIGKPPGLALAPAASADNGERMRANSVSPGCAASGSALGAETKHASRPRLDIDARRRLGGGGRRRGQPKGLGTRPVEAERDGLVEGQREQQRHVPQPAQDVCLLVAQLEAHFVIPGREQLLRRAAGLEVAVRDHALVGVEESVELRLERRVVQCHVDAGEAHRDVTLVLEGELVPEDVVVDDAPVGGPRIAEGGRAVQRRSRRQQRARVRPDRALERGE